jgi:hypothetical protein
MNQAALRGEGNNTWMSGQVSDLVALCRPFRNRSSKEASQTGLGSRRDESCENRRINYMIRALSRPLIALASASHRTHQAGGNERYS